MKLQQNVEKVDLYFLVTYSCQFKLLYFHLLSTSVPHFYDSFLMNIISGEHSWVIIDKMLGVCNTKWLFYFFSCCFTLFLIPYQLTNIYLHLQSSDQSHSLYCSWKQWDSSKNAWIWIWKSKWDGTPCKVSF